MLLGDVTGLSKGSEKRVILKCDICSAVTTTTYANYYRSQERRNWSGETVCRKCVCKISAKKRRGKPAHNKGKKLPLEKKGQNHSSWKGGQYVSGDGYRMIYVGKQSNNSGWSSYRKEHIVVMEAHLNKRLDRSAVIHHLDGNKINNSIDNLWLTNQNGHRNAHSSLQELGYLLYRDGLIGFDTIKGTYFLKDKNENTKST